MKESSGFPLDDFMDDIEAPEPTDDWEKTRRKEQEQGAKMLARANLAGGVSDEESITKSILKFQDAARIMRGMF